MKWRGLLRITSEVVKYPRAFVITLGIPGLLALSRLTENDWTPIPAITEFLHNTGVAIVIPVLLVITSFGAVLRGFRRLIREKWFVAYLLLLAALMLCSFLTGTATRRSQVIASAIALSWTLSLIVSYTSVRSLAEYRAWNRLMDVLGILMMCSVFASLLLPLLFSVNFGEAILQDGRLRAFGPLGDQVGFALILFALRSATRKAWLMHLIYVLAIFSTGTRGAVIALVVGLFYISVAGDMRPGKSASKKTIKLRSLGLLLIPAALMAIAASFDMLNRVTNVLDEDSSINQRLGAMKIALDVFRASPLVGMGFNSMYFHAQAFGAVEKFSADLMSRSAGTAQSQILQMASDGGILGLGAFLALLVALKERLDRVRTTINDRQLNIDVGDVKAVLGFLIAIGIGNQSAVWMLSESITNYLFFLSIGIALALLRVSEVNSQYYRE
jgi:O-antigen ligase